jgi:hypothetical protein
MKGKKNTMKRKTVKITKGCLKPGEPHPAAYFAKEYIAALGIEKIVIWQSTFSSNAIEGNRLAEICAETLDRLIKGLPVSDRYILGLYCTIKQTEEIIK